MGREWVGQGLPAGGSARAKADKLGWVWGDSRESRVVITKSQEVRSGGDAGRGSREWG